MNAPTDSQPQSEKESPLESASAEPEAEKKTRKRKRKDVYVEEKLIEFDAEKVYPKNWAQVHRRSKFSSAPSNTKQAVSLDPLLVAFKTPLDYERFKSQITEQEVLTVGMFEGLKMSCCLNLCSEENYYNTFEWETVGVKYIHVPLENVNVKQLKVPDKVLVDQAIAIMRQFDINYPDQRIGLHDSYGYNYVGYVIVCFLVEAKGWSVDAALSWFAKVRSPGVYYREFIDDLYKRYDEISSGLFTPGDVPRWDTFYKTPVKSQGKPLVSKPVAYGKKPVEQAKSSHAPVGLPSHPGVTVREPHSIEFLSKIKKLLNDEFEAFSYPNPKSDIVASFDSVEGDIFLSWEPVGTKYLLMIIEEGVFLVSEKKDVYHVKPFNFSSSLLNTVLSGVLVNDKDPSSRKFTQRFVISDILVHSGKLLMNDVAFTERLKILNEFIDKRKSLDRKLIEQEPFRLRAALMLEPKDLDKLRTSILPALPHEYKCITAYKKDFLYSADQPVCFKMEK